jgi:hypothetical protein
VERPVQRSLRHRPGGCSGRAGEEGQRSRQQGTRQLSAAERTGEQPVVIAVVYRAVRAVADIIRSIISAMVCWLRAEMPIAASALTLRFNVRTPASALMI